MGFSHMVVFEYLPKAFCAGKLIYNLAMGGQIIDASIVAVPKQRNSRDENAKIKEGETPQGWEDNPARRCQKDTDARWTKKHGKSHYGYKNHVNIDRRHKLVRRYQVTDAAVHDSQVIEDVLDPDNTASDVWADSAYRSAEIEAKLADKGLKSRIHRKGHRNKPLTNREMQGNKTRSKVRARVEHVFGAQSNYSCNWVDPVRAHDRITNSRSGVWRMFIFMHLVGMDCFACGPLADRQSGVMVQGRYSRAKRSSTHISPQTPAFRTGR